MAKTAGKGSSESSGRRPKMNTRKIRVIREKKRGTKSKFWRVPQQREMPQFGIEYGR